MHPADPIRDRLEALERHVNRVERRLRWWRGLAGGFVVLALLSLTWKPGTVADAQSTGLADQFAALQAEVAALRDKLRHITVAADENGLPEVVITGANLRIVNGLGQTDCESEEGPIPDCPNGLGNLIVGYNESRPPFANDDSGEDPNVRTGSHNVVVGQFHNFSRFGGLVVGFSNEISGDFAAVSGGTGNTASGNFASVSGGQINTASDAFATVSGGVGNTASAGNSTVSGGSDNTASGGQATVSGGSNNTASGDYAVVSGGLNRTAEGEFDWVAGPLFHDE